MAASEPQLAKREHIRRDRTEHRRRFLKTAWARSMRARVAWVIVNARVLGFRGCIFHLSGVVWPKIAYVVLSRTPTDLVRLLHRAHTVKSSARRIYETQRRLRMIGLAPSVRKGEVNESYLEGGDGRTNLCEFVKVA